jgi:hypothetical protein
MSAPAVALPPAEPDAAASHRLPENVRRANAYRFAVAQAKDLGIPLRHVDQCLARTLKGRL